jgi:hypothetical protein
MSKNRNGSGEIKKIPRCRGIFGNEEAELGRVSLCHEAVLAEDRLAALLDGARLERHLALRTTFGAHGGVHLPRRKALALAGSATILAALWGAEVPACIELLFAFREGKGVPAIAAGELLISHKKGKKDIKMHFPSSGFSVADRTGLKE